MAGNRAAGVPKLKMAKALWEGTEPVQALEKFKKNGPGFSFVLNPYSAFTTAVPWGISRGTNPGGFGNRYGTPTANEAR